MNIFETLNATGVMWFFVYLAIAIVGGLIVGWLIANASKTKMAQAYNTLKDSYDDSMKLNQEQDAQIALQTAELKKLTAELKQEKNNTAQYEAQKNELFAEVSKLKQSETRLKEALDDTHREIEVAKAAAVAETAQLLEAEQQTATHLREQLTALQTEKAVLKTQVAEHTDALAQLNALQQLYKETQARVKALEEDAEQKAAAAQPLMLAQTPAENQPTETAEPKVAAADQPTEAVAASHNDELETAKQTIETLQREIHLKNQEIERLLADLKEEQAEPDAVAVDHTTNDLLLKIQQFKNTIKTLQREVFLKEEEIQLLLAELKEEQAEPDAVATDHDANELLVKLQEAETTIKTLRREVFLKEEEIALMLQAAATPVAAEPAPAPDLTAELETAQKTIKTLQREVFLKEEEIQLLLAELEKERAEADATEVTAKLEEAEAATKTLRREVFLKEEEIGQMLQAAAAQPVVEVAPASDFAAELEAAQKTIKTLQREIYLKDEEIQLLLADLQEEQAEPDAVATDFNANELLIKIQELKTTVKNLQREVFLKDEEIAQLLQTPASHEPATENNAVVVAAPPAAVAKVTRTKEEAIKLLSGLIGEKIVAATSAEKDDLRKIIGIGSFIERKLNLLGIFTYRQVSQFDDEAIELVTAAIEFFPGRIQKDDWVGQAKRLIQ